MNNVNNDNNNNDEQMVEQIKELSKLRNDIMLKYNDILNLYNSFNFKTVHHSIKRLIKKPVQIFKQM